MKKVFLALAISVAFPCHAQTGLKSAKEILVLLPQKPNDNSYLMSEGSDAPDLTTAIGRWRRDARAFRLSSSKYSAERNAQRWLQLAQLRLKLPAQDATSYEPRPEFSALVRALPAPPHWAALFHAAQASYRKSPSKVNAATWYFAARLVNDAQGQTDALSALYRIMAPLYQKSLQERSLYSESALPSQRTPQWVQAVQKWKSSIADLVGLAELLKDSPSPAQKAIGMQWQLALTPIQEGIRQYTVPDLVGQLGEKAAVPLLRQILASGTQLEWYAAGEKTQNLAGKIWLSTPALQRKAQWGLVSVSKDRKFAQLMLDKFARPGIKTEESNILYARSVVLNGLVKEKQFSLATQKLEAWLKSQKPSNNQSEWDSIRVPTINNESPRSLQLQQLAWIETTLKKHPDLPWWGSYSSESQRLGQTAHRLQLLKDLSSRPIITTLPAAAYRRFVLALSSAYLDSNASKTGGDTLVRALQISIKDKNASALSSDVTSLLQLNRLVPNPNWLQVARQGATLLFSSELGAEMKGVDAAEHTQIALRFAAQKQVAFAQSLLIGKLRDVNNTQLKDHYFGDDEEKRRAYLYGLMEIYHQANRPADMVSLLQNATGWGKKELTPLLLYKGTHLWDVEYDNPELKALPRLGYLAAWALARTNQKAKAITVTRALIERATGYDDAYRLLCDLQGEQARAFLQKLAAADPFEERPLIWQAYLSRRAKNYSQAQKLAAQAITIDPSDGEQGPGDRLRAYAELSAALRGLNQPAQAQKMETAVGAIRLAEKADSYRIAGLSSRAIAMYEQSLRYFDDAYCVQSRLAVQLASLGHYEQASQHFRRAYELMPVSFGRLESHCFGCEGVFGGKEQNSIARQVFLTLENARPNDPKVAYLSGYWRETAGQQKEAVRYYERAVKLDPQYLSAWKKLAGSSELLTPKQSDWATLNVLRLDPGGRHGDGYGVSYQIKGDYKGLWNTTQAVLPRIAPRSKANIPLKIAPDEMEWNDYDTWELIRKPADAIAGQQFVSATSAVIE